MFKVGNDRKSLRTTAELKMERAEGLLGGKSLFKSQNDGTINKTEVVCNICQAEFSYHRSSSSLSYHPNAKHPTESSPRLDDRQPTLHDFSRKIIVVHRCICRTSVVADIRLVYCHRCIGNKLDFHRWHWPMFIGMFSALLYSYSVYRECGIRRQTPFILTHTQAATITQCLPGDYIKCDQ